jgi:hypothetical protein
MKDRNRFALWIHSGVAALALASAAFAGAQPRAAAPTAPQAPARATVASAAQAPSEADVAETQDELIKILRLSPVLTSVVARDPSLLSDQAYVSRNNPELAQFLLTHPDVARNPEFYLFSHLNQGGGRRDQALERVIWPDFPQQPSRGFEMGEVMGNLVPIIIVPAFFFAAVWIIRMFVESRRWNRTFKMQTDMQGRLIDKFSSSQELAAYMQSEAGKSLLLASPWGSEPAPHMPNAVARVLTPLQVGIVLTLLGVGLLFLRHAGVDMEEPMAVLGTLVLTPGLGFILSAAVTWFLAKRLGLLPEKDEAESAQAVPSGPYKQ